MTKAFLINYDDCFGCHACEVACQMLHDLPVGQYGIKVECVGPWEYGTKSYCHFFVPVYTAQCTQCPERTSAGLLPSCVQHCEAQCLRYGDVDDLAAELDGQQKLILQVPPKPCSGAIA